MTWNKEWSSVVLALCFILIVMQLWGITCPILFLAGISCAGCGMTRAWIACFHLQFFKAFSYHPLFWMPGLWTIVWYFRNHISVRTRKWITRLSIIIFLIVYAIRMASPLDQIVIFEPKNGAFFRMITYIYSKMR